MHYFNIKDKKNIQPKYLDIYFHNTLQIWTKYKAPDYFNKPWNGSIVFKPLLSKWNIQNQYKTGHNMSYALNKMLLIISKM